MHDPVHSPAHYVGDDPVYECIKVAEAWGFHKRAGLFNVLKYICRAGKKDPAKEIEDLKKARFYLDWEIRILEKAQDKNPFTETTGNPYKHLPSFAGLRVPDLSEVCEAARKCE